jgi:mRNA interferase HigB
LLKRLLQIITKWYYSIVRVIAHTRLVALADPWPEARQAVEDWYEAVTAAVWSSPADIKASDPTASILATRRVVFNILGNRFRLIVKVD